MTILEIARDAEQKCILYTMKAAKRSIMIACVGRPDLDGKFTSILDAGSKSQFLKRIAKLIEENSNEF